MSIKDGLPTDCSSCVTSLLEYSIVQESQGTAASPFGFLCLVSYVHLRFFYIEKYCTVPWQILVILLKDIYEQLSKYSTMVG